MKTRNSKRLLPDLKNQTSSTVIVKSEIVDDATPIEDTLSKDPLQQKIKQEKCDASENSETVWFEEEKLVKREISESLEEEMIIKEENTLDCDDDDALDHNYDVADWVETQLDVDNTDLNLTTDEPVRKNEKNHIDIVTLSNWRNCIGKKLDSSGSKVKTKKQGNKIIKQANAMPKKQVTRKPKPTPFKCDLCDKSFTLFHRLASHTFQHTGEKPYQCDICKRRFGRIDNLKSHEYTHAKVKPFQCDICDKYFTLSHHLNTHKRLHTGEKPFECDVCKKRFARSDNLKSHKVLHSGEKPFLCDLCDKCFARKDNLRKHKRMHTGARPYKCDICSGCFSRSDNLKAHKLLHFKDKI